MRKAFLRTPVKFGRVSSRFNLKRRHPVLHKIRAHRGVDYAASRGTAIRASGDGKVILVGRKGGYGRTVILRHGSTYTTLYAHMSRYAKGMRPGQRVQQGQLIGYVGRSGLATGSHLHYEFRVRNVHRNPLTVKLPKAAPVPERQKSDFLRKTGKLVTQLHVLSRMRLARSN
jgi:murein DD-endopeptidase MepM/ murein hydrolase activator NlpD